MTCPGADELLAFHRSADPVRRRDIVAHLAQCDVCRERVLEAMDSTGRRRQLTPRVAIAACILAVVILSAALVWYMQRPRSTSAPSAGRSIEPRLRGPSSVMASVGPAADPHSTGVQA